MSINKQTPLLADSLRECLINIKNNHDSNIACDLLNADAIITT